MTSRYLADVVFIVMAAVAAFVLAGMPGNMKAPVSRPAPVPAMAKTAPEVKSIEVGQKKVGAAIEERNIFAASGTYKDNAQVPVPDNPYVLLGTVREKGGLKAFFREYTGTVAKAAAGYRMIDGFRVATVQNRQVVLKKRQERKVFNVYGTSIAPAAGQGDMKNISGQKPLLVAILEGSRKRAVFKDYAGNWTVLETGRSLPDGSVIVRIDSRSVRLRQGKEAKELMLYAQVFPKDREQNVQSVSPIRAFPKKALPLPSVPAWRKPNSPNNKAGENDRGDAQ